MKPKTHRRKNLLQDDHERDNCYTPAYALDPLLPYLPANARIWEPAAGDGHLVRALRAAHYPVLDSEIRRSPDQDFFTYTPTDWTVLVTNPPYSIKYNWLTRCYTLGKPFALLVPVETIGAGQAQRLFRRYGVELLLLNRRVNFQMPRKGFAGGGAQFPVLWLCWQLLPAPICYGSIVYRSEGQLTLDLEAA